MNGLDPEKVHEENEDSGCQSAIITANEYTEIAYHAKNGNKIFKDQARLFYSNKIFRNKN